MNRPSRAPFYFIICGLILLGLGTAWLRHVHMEIPFLAGEERPVWLVEARVDFVAQGDEVTVSLGLPQYSPGFRRVMEQAASPGYGWAVIESENSRRGEWTKREARGAQTLYYKAQFVGGVDTRDELIVDLPRAYSVEWDGPQATASSQILSQALATSSSARSLARELIKLLNDPTPDQNASLMLTAESDKAVLLEKLLNQADIPARGVLGLYLEDARRYQSLTRMVELFDKDQWIVFNPYTGAEGVPDNLLLWHRNDSALLDVIGGSRSRIGFSMIYQTVPALELAKSDVKDNIFSIIGVHSLPIEEQSMFKLLFLLPLGALVVVFMRVIVGLKTSGTFMPILIAMAFLQTSLYLGLFSFITVVAFGLVLRTYLSRLNLLLISRIATLVVLVIFIISVLSLVGYQMGLNTGMTITFFPMIIIAWTIERMSILWEEEGPKEVLVQGGGSLLVAVLAYSLMQVPGVGHLTFNFPELNLVFLALIMLMGQYTGYKVSELRRFRAMVDNEAAEKGADNR